MRIKLYPLQPFPRTNKMHTRAVIFCCWFSLVHCVFFSLVACAVLLLLFGLHFSKQEFLARTSFFYVLSSCCCCGCRRCSMLLQSCLFYSFFVAFCIFAIFLCADFSTTIQLLLCMLSLPVFAILSSLYALEWARATQSLFLFHWSLLMLLRLFFFSFILFNIFPFLYLWVPWYALNARIYLSIYFSDMIPRRCFPSIAWTWQHMHTC